MRPDKTRKRNRRIISSSIKSTIHISGSSTYITLPENLLNTGVLTNYFHLIKDGLIYIVTYINVHKLNKTDTFLYINPQFLRNRKIKIQGTIFYEILQKFVRVTTRLPPNVKPIELTQKYLDYSVLVNKLESLRPPQAELRNIVYKLRKGKRHVLNDNEVIAALKAKFQGKYNIIVIDFDGKTFEEQIEAMNGCILFLGCHGAGFTNAYFMARHTNMLEFFPESFYTDVFKVICKRKQINHFFLNGISIITPPITLNKYINNRHDPKYDNPVFRGSIRDISFTMDCKQVIKKVSEILPA